MTAFDSLLRKIRREMPYKRPIGRLQRVANLPIFLYLLYFD